MKTCLLPVLLLIFVANFSYAENPLVLELAPGVDNPRNSEGDFVRLKNGNILFVYSCYVGTSTSDDAHANLAMRESADGGKTWGEPKIVVENPGGMNVMSVSFLRLQDGRIALFYLWKFSRQDCRPNVCFSGDEGKTWSEPVTCLPNADELGYYVVNNSRIVQLADGTVVIPVALHNLHVEKFDPNARIFCYLSTDGCRTFHRGAAVENPGVTFQEPGVIQMADGRVLMYIRTNGKSQYLAWSSDGCRTWTAGAPSHFTSPMSPATMRPIPDSNKILVVWNESPTERNPLTYAVVNQNLEILEKGLVDESTRELDGENPRWFCYPAVLPLDGETFLTAYCAGLKRNWGLDTTRIRLLKTKKTSNISDSSVDKSGGIE